MAQKATFPLTELHRSYLSTVRPWYYKPDVRLLGVMSDFWLAVLGPVIAYWLFCALFEILDKAEWEWLNEYRIHEGSEAILQNRAARGQVFAVVILQQIIQIALSYFWIDENTKTGGSILTRVPLMEALAPTVLRSLEVVVGHSFAVYLWLHKAQDLVYYAYWWAIPLAQLFAGS